MEFINKKNDEDAQEITHSIVESVKRRKEVAAEARSKRKHSDENFEPIIPKKRKNRKKSSSNALEDKLRKQSSNIDITASRLPYLHGLAVKNSGEGSSKPHKKSEAKLIYRHDKQARDFMFVP